jgi:hypothetical protein
LINGRRTVAASCQFAVPQFLFAVGVAALLPAKPSFAEPDQLPVSNSPQAAPAKFDVKALASPPEVFPTNDFAAEGVRAFFYEGLIYQGKPTRVFAYYGFPKGAKGAKFPAMVLIHGGGGTAFDRWVRVWTARGYAAIAMDLCGCVPDGTYGNWKRHGQGGPPGWDASFDQIDAPKHTRRVDRNHGFAERDLRAPGYQPHIADRHSLDRIRSSIRGVVADVVKDMKVQQRANENTVNVLTSLK